MILAKILAESVNRKPSDIILSVNKYPTLKINGDIEPLIEYGILKKDKLNEEILSILTSEQRKQFLEQYELDFSLVSEEGRRFRVNAYVQKDGYGLVLRPIMKDILSFEELGLPNQMIEFTKARSGLVLITGSVGSGKSTSLSALIQHINENCKKHIITIEDPIEYEYDNKKSLIDQRDVGENTKSFDNGLKYALRQAADVIMVGEMRDLDTFRLALRAAETGTLVFATLHTSGAARTVARIIDMFPSGEKEQIKAQLSDSLVGVVWQDLIKKADGEGRVPAVEIMVNTTSVANMIRKGLNHQLDSVIETSVDEGMITMKSSLEELFTKGIISEKEYNYNIAKYTKLS